MHAVEPAGGKTKFGGALGTIPLAEFVFALLEPGQFTLHDLDQPLAAIGVKLRLFRCHDTLPTHDATMIAQRQMPEKALGCIARTRAALRRARSGDAGRPASARRSQARRLQRGFDADGSLVLTRPVQQRVAPFARVLCKLLLTSPCLLDVRLETVSLQQGRSLCSIGRVAAAARVLLSRRVWVRRRCCRIIPLPPLAEELSF